MTIRNITSTALELRAVERYAPPAELAPKPPPLNEPVKHIKNFTRSIKNFVANDSNAPPSSPAVAQGSQSFSAQDVSIQMQPFQTVTTDITAADQASKETVRLTFEHEGERYRVDTPSQSNASSKLVALTPNPCHDFTAIYLPPSAHLTLFSSANLSSWMSRMRDDTPLSALSIPGTHNSPTYHRALPSVRCQAVNVPTQLDNGVRFLDIRVQPDEPENKSIDTLILVHGVFPISLSGNKYLRDVVNEVLSFLDRNPTETVIMSIKREGPGNHNDAQLSRRLRDHYANDVNRWFTAPHIPTLGEARRKIVLMRRFALDEGLKGEWGGAGWCINAESWAYNTPNNTAPGGQVVVQDFCEVLEATNIGQKAQYCQEHFARAAERVCPLPGIDMQVDQQPPPPPMPPFYLNFLSASNFWSTQTWPERIAERLNPAMIEYLCRRHDAVDGPDGGRGDGSTGVVVCDWVGKDGDWDLVRCIVGMNAKLEMRQRLPRP